MLLSLLLTSVCKIELNNERLDLYSYGELLDVQLIYIGYFAYSISAIKHGLKCTNYQRC